MLANAEPILWCEVSQSLHVARQVVTEPLDFCKYAPLCRFRQTPQVLDGLRFEFDAVGHANFTPANNLLSRSGALQARMDLVERSLQLYQKTAPAVLRVRAAVLAVDRRLMREGGRPSVKHGPKGTCRFR